MIEMADDEAPIIQLNQLMQERDRIAPTRDADEVPLLRRKLLENLQLETTVIGGPLRHRAHSIVSGAHRGERLSNQSPFDNE